jgi:hypothetical protein
MSQNPLTSLAMGIGAPNKNDIGLSNPYSPPPGGGLSIGQQQNVNRAANTPLTYPVSPAVSTPPAYHVGPDGRLYDAQGRPVQQ